VVEDLQVLHRATQRVARIATNLRSFARQGPHEYAPVNLNGVVEETLLLMQKPLEVDGIRIIASLDPTPPRGRSSRWRPSRRQQRGPARSRPSAPAPDRDSGATGA